MCGETKNLLYRIQANLEEGHVEQGHGLWRDKKFAVSNTSELRGHGV